MPKYLISCTLFFFCPLLFNAQVRSLAELSPEERCNTAGILATDPKKTFQDYAGEYPQPIQLKVRALKEGYGKCCMIAHGPAGMGKTQLSEIIAGVTGRTHYRYNCGNNSTEMQASGPQLLKALVAHIKNNKKPAVLLLDELQSIGRDCDVKNQQGQNTLDTLLAITEEANKDPERLIYIVGTTNSYDTLSPFLKSRFMGSVYEIPLPNYENRKKKIIALLNSACKKSNSTQIATTLINQLAKDTENFSFRDLDSYVEYIEELACNNNHIITDALIAQALKQFKLQEKKNLLAWFKDQDPETQKLLSGITQHVTSAGIITAAGTSLYLIKQCFTQHTQKHGTLLFDSCTFQGMPIVPAGTTATFKNCTIHINFADSTVASETTQQLGQNSAQGITPHTSFGSLFIKGVAFQIILFAAAEAYDIFRENCCPTDQQKEFFKKHSELLQNIEYLDTEGKRLAQEKINAIRAETKALDHKIAQRNVRREFFKSLAQYENDVSNDTGLPISCEKIAEEFKKVCGEDEYINELAAFNERRMDVIQRIGKKNIKERLTEELNTHKSGPFNKTGLPIACEGTAKAFKKLWGENEYNRMLATLNKNQKEKSKPYLKEINDKRV